MLLRPCLVSLCLLLAACGGRREVAPSAPTYAPVATSRGAAGYCAEQGGRLEQRQEAGSIMGYCHLPSGEVLEEWKLHQGKNSL